MRDGVLEQVGVCGEILQLVDRVVEADHGGFAGRPHHGLREENAGFAHLRQEGFDARTCLEQDDHGERVAAEIEVGDPLSYAIVGNPKIAGLQIVNHFAAAIAHGHRRVYQSDPHFDLGLRVLGRLLDLGAGFRCNRPGRGLCAGGSVGQSQKKRQS